MAQVTVSARSGAPEETAADTRVIGVFEGDSLADPALQRLIELGEAKRGLKKVAVAHEDAPGGGQRRVLIAGLGERERVRRGAGAGGGGVGGGAREGAGRGVALLGGARRRRVAAALVEGTLLKLYSFDRFKSQSGDDGANGGVESLEVTGEGVSADEVELGRVAAGAANAARDLQNLPANVATPTFLAERATEIADAYESLEVELLDREAIVARGMGAFASVAQGSHVEPRLIVLRYRPRRRERPAPRLRGQGRDLRHGRDLDQALGEDAGHEVRHVRRRRGHRVDGRDRRAGPAADRHGGGALHGEHAERPRGQAGRHRHRDERQDDRGEQHRRRGPPDPGGRALLRRGARAPSGSWTWRPLTGAIIVALGHTYAGLFSNDDDWCGEVSAACDASGEIGWRMPLHQEYFDLTKGQYADLTNAAEGRVAMSCYAAEFLRQFVDDRPWVHVDIAGTAWGLTRNYVAKGASGFGTRMLIELARRSAG